MAATTDVTEMLKYTYAKEQLSYMATQEVPLWNIISRKKTPMGGRGQYILPIQTANTGVFVGHAEGGSLTTTRAQPSTTEATFALQEFHGIYNVTWKALQDARNSQFAMERMGEFLDNSMRRRVFRQLNAEVNGFGKGEMGIMRAADNGTTVTFRALPMVDQGMVVDVMDLSDDNAKISNSATVNAINVRTREGPLSVATSGSAAGDDLTVEDSVSSAGGSLHLVGILAWIDDANPDSVVGNIGGINRSTAGNEFWQANVLSNSGNGNRPLTEDLLLQGFDLVRERGGKKLTHIMSNLAIMRRYHEMLRGETIASLGSVGPVGGGLGRPEGEMQDGAEGQGGTPYNFSGVNWHSDIFFDANRIVGFNNENWVIAHGENEMPEPIGDIFDVPMLKRTSTAGFDVDHYWQGELICDNPTTAVKWEEISEA